MTSDNVLYNKNKILITRNRLVFQGNQYQIRHVYKLKRDKKDPKDKPVEGGLSLLFLLFSVSLYLRQLIGTWLLLAVGYLLYLETGPEPIFELVVTTTKDEILTLKPKDGKDADEMQKALESAMDMLAPK